MNQHNHNLSNRGEISSRDILITAAITITAAIIIVVAVILIAGRKQPSALPGQTGAGVSSGQGSTGAQQPETKPLEPAEATFTGSIVARTETDITISQRNSGKLVSLSLTADTVITFQGAPYELSELRIGDALEAVADVFSTGEIVAQSITVLTSTAPTAPSSINPNAPSSAEPAYTPPSRRKAL